MSTTERPARRRFETRFRAAFASVTFDAGELANQQFVRYVHYVQLGRWVEAHRGHRPDPRVIEFGDSNGVIRGFFDTPRYEVARFPETDVQDLGGYEDGSYDVAVLDHVLEHVADPWRAVSEVHRILSRGGSCICTTPFLVRIHRYPEDYWRFAPEGLRELFGSFSAVEVTGWGNRFTLHTTLRLGWLSARNTKRLLRVTLWNEPEWPIVHLTIAHK